jgi:hypothetical protein
MATYTQCDSPTPCKVLESTDIWMNASDFHMPKHVLCSRKIGPLRPFAEI